MPKAKGGGGCQSRVYRCCRCEGEGGGGGGGWLLSVGCVTRQCRDDEVRETPVTSIAELILRVKASVCKQPCIPCTAVDPKPRALRQSPG